MIRKLKFAAVAVLLTAGIASTTALAYGGHDFGHAYIQSNRLDQLSYGNSRVWNPETRQFPVPADVGRNNMVD